MVKTRMGLLDLRVQSATLNATLAGARVANVYDAHNGRTYILKLAVPPATPSAASSIQSSWQKRLLLIESGARLHVTHFDREKDLPTGFCLKLRKHIRTRRLDAVNQLGGDRIMDLVFSGAGEVVAHLIVEAFSGGNVILTDANYNILTLLRTYRPQTPTAAPVAVRERYPLHKARPAARLTESAFIDAVRAAADAAPSADELAAAPTRALRRKLATRTQPRKALAVALALEPALVEHALRSGGAPESLRELAENERMLGEVYAAIEGVDLELERKLVEGEAVGGFIVSGKVEVEGQMRERYEEFSPFLFEQYKEKKVTEFKTFDEAADEFFSRLESGRAEALQAKREAAAYKKVDKLASELKGQVSILENARDLSWERAQAIEGNIAEVEAAIMVINSAIAAAVAWDQLAQMVKDEKKNGNPVAEIIHSLQLDKNEITLMLEDTFGVGDEDEIDEEMDEGDDDDDNDDDDDDDDDGDGDAGPHDSNKRLGSLRKRRQRFESSSQTRKALLVSVDLSLGAHANARRHYELRKNAAAKMEKAVEVTDRTIKAASKRAATEAHKIEADAVAASIRARRKALWFEKFYWFVSSENYLVVAGRDAQQNELLVNRYLGPADVYVHAELPGASSVIVKNQKRPGEAFHGDVPQLTLEQAGTFAMSRSTAWEAKIVTSAWWVRSSQVSKTMPSGAYLPTGSFMIRGKKTFLDPNQLVMGLAFLFKVDETCIASHAGERGVRGMDQELNSGEMAQTEFGTSKGQEREDANFVKHCSGDEDKREDSLTPGDSDAAQDLGLTSVAEEPQIENDEEFADPAVEKDVDGISDTAQQEYTGSSLTNKAPRSKKKHLSARERRALKNGKAKETNVIEQPDVSSDQASEPESTSSARSKKQTGSKTNAPLPRGKKHKLKKMKKYSDQDEEERKIALAVLGSKPIKEIEDDAENENDTAGSEGHEDSVANEESGNQKKRRENRVEKREVMRLMEEEGLVELTKLEQETLATLDMLTAIPTPTDSIQFALPVCAPYNSLTNYRYKVKLMPGNMKRGKAYRAGIVLFLKQAEKDLSQFKQDRDAIRFSPESDGIHGMLGSVQIMAPGLAEAQKAIQKSKKSSSKKSSKK